MSKYAPVIVALAWVAASILFFTHSMMVGGTAINGKIVAGHFFVGAKGNYPEVSRGVYVLSAVLSALFGLCLPLFAGVMTWHESRKPTFSKLLWIGPVLTLPFGLGMCWLSVRSILNAF